MILLFYAKAPVARNNHPFFFLLSACIFMFNKAVFIISSFFFFIELVRGHINPILGKHQLTCVESLNSRRATRFGYG